MSEPACLACDGTWPSVRLRIVDCGLSVAYLQDDQFFPGWTILVLKRHATELYHLGAAERAQLIEEVNRVAEALAAEYDARKMNYELLGNQVPHIHWHLIPRGANDPSPREPVWSVPHATKRLADDELAARLSSLRRRLAPASK